MTDRELLELAAKAAGMTGCCAEYENPDRLVFLLDESNKEWNPLEYDGDALRLAIILRLCIYTWEHFIEVEGIDVVFRDDPMEATRRAIVRAAAEIGKEMK